MSNGNNTVEVVIGAVVFIAVLVAGVVVSLVKKQSLSSSATKNHSQEKNDVLLVPITIVSLLSVEDIKDSEQQQDKSLLFKNSVSWWVGETKQWQQIISQIVALPLDVLPNDERESVYIAYDIILPANQIPKNKFSLQSKIKELDTQNGLKNKKIFKFDNNHQIIDYGFK